VDFLFYLAGLVLIFIVTFHAIRQKLKASRKKIPVICPGAIRVTDQQGRDMLIVRKEDGSFEMLEEHIIRKQGAGK
jgi:hypothetical protein